MLTIRRLSRRLSWVAFLAIFGLALVPTLSRALAGLGGDAAWVEICTPQGARWLALAEPAAAEASERAMSADAAEPPAPAVSSHLDHCPLCGLAASAPPLAQAALALAPSAIAARLWLATDSQLPSRLRAWSAAQARAPPRFG